MSGGGAVPIHRRALSSTGKLRLPLASTGGYLQLKSRRGWMAEAYIVAAARTAGGRRGGKLKDWHPADLGGAVLDALVQRAGIDGAAVEDVIMGCVGQAGEQSAHIGRSAV